MISASYELRTSLRDTHQPSLSPVILHIKMTRLGLFLNQMVYKVYVILHNLSVANTDLKYFAYFVLLVLGTDRPCRD